MFDVIWTDPNRESVGERKQRKVAEGKAKKKEQNRLFRASVSTHSSASSGQKSVAGSSDQKKASPISQRTVNARQPHRDSLLPSPTTTTSSHPHPVHYAEDAIATKDRILEDISEASPGLDSRDSIFSSHNEYASAPMTPASVFGGSHMHQDSSSKVIQTLGPCSYITKTTEVVSAPRSPELDCDQIMTDVTISATPSHRLVLPATPPSPGHLGKTIHTKKWLSSIPNRARSLSPGKEHAGHRLGPLPPVPNPKLVSVARNTQLPTAPHNPQLPSTPRNPQLPSTPRNPRGLTIAAPSSVFWNDNPDSWRPPDAWDCTPSAKTMPTSLDAIMNFSTEEQSRDSSLPSLDLIAMQREIKMMEAATPQTILTRLNEEWDDSPDPALYQEMAMEKTRWMLSAMYNIDRPNVDGNEVGSSMVPARRGKGTKILALFESPATASYLAAAHCDSFIYHTSPTPISNDLFPNVLPTTLPVMSHAALSTAPKMFSAVYCLSLPSLMPSQEIPPLLRNIHRTIAPGGSLHLTLIDPVPTTRTLGPRMRLWLEENLVLNLERKFRCISPRKLVPGWLGDASLRGAGSTITTVKFYAIPPARTPATPTARTPEFVSPTTPGRADDCASSSAGSSSSSRRADRQIRTELRSVVGRMLWREVWGSYVTANRWWWEDPLCVRECQEFGTHWEYNIIKAAKE